MKKKGKIIELLFNPTLLQTKPASSETGSISGTCGEREPFLAVGYSNPIFWKSDTNNTFHPFRGLQILAETPVKSRFRTEKGLFIVLKSYLQSSVGMDGLKIGHAVWICCSNIK